MEPKVQPGQLTVDALLQRFSPLASLRIETTQFQDDPDGRQCLQSSEPKYEEVLDELATVAKHTPLPLIEALLKWREIESPQGAGDTCTYQRRLAVEYIFCSACIRFVNACPPDGLNETLWLVLEDFVFDWVINADRLVSHTEHPSLADLRTLLLDHAALLLGELSRVRFASTTGRFFTEISTRRMNTGPQRQESLRLIHGMRYLRLGVSTPVALNASTDFLIRANPLSCTSAKKKTEFHHALCNMLASILRLLAGSGSRRWPPRGVDEALALWYEAVFRLRQQLQLWMKQRSKHTLVGYPLITLLLCFGHPQYFVTTFQPYLDALYKRLKGKKCRSMALDCLHLLLWFFLNMYGDMQPRSVTAGYLSSITSQVLGILKKGSFNLPDQHDKLVEFSVTVAENHLEFAMSSIILELLCSDDGLGEAKVVGLRALLAIARPTTPKLNSGAPGPHGTGNGSLQLASALRSVTPGGSSSVASSSTAFASAIPSSPRRLNVSVSQQAALYNNSGGVLPSEADCLRSCVQKIRTAVRAIIKACHRQYGQALLTSPRTAMNRQTKKEQQGWQVFQWALKCLPHLIPEDWCDDKMAENISVYTISAEPRVREEAVKLLFRAVQDLPKRRFAVVRGMANFILRIPDKFPLLISTSLGRLLELLNAWRTCVAEEATLALTQQQSASASHDTEASGIGAVPTPPAPTPPPEVSDENRHFDSSGMDAVGLVFLCSADSQIRCTTLELLHAVRALQTDPGAHRSQPLQRPRPETTYLIDVLEQRGEEIVQRCCLDDSWWQGLSLESEGVPVDVSLSSILEGSNNGRWAQCLSELVKHVAELCPAPVLGARLEVVERLASITPGEVAGGRRSENKFDQWRNYCMFACACPPENGPLNGAESMKELLRLVSPVITIGKEAQHAAWMALRHSHPAIREALLEEGVNHGDETANRLNRSSGGIFPLSIHQQ